ncbi:MAG: HAD hydrolase-like protein [Clostridia bacterium]|nr:HAD hydrolase-like protein [Clostridia bacterium]
MKTKAVIFDLDGTLLDTLGDITDSVNRTLRRFGFAPRTQDEIRRFVGNGAVKLIERALPQPVDDALFAQIYRAYDADYNAHGQDKTRPYPGVCETLQTLREAGVRTAVLSNKQDGAVRVLCAHYFPGLLDAATGPTAQRRTKPAPDGVRYLETLLGVSCDEVLYVGDSETDVQTGLNAGVRTVAALWGFRDRDTLERAGAAMFAKNMWDVLKYVDIPKKM